MQLFSWTVETPQGAPAETAPTPDQIAAATAFRDLALDDNGDIYLDASGDLAGVSGRAAVASDLRSRLQTFLGEYIWNTGIGFPWRQEVLGEKVSLARFEELVRAETLATPGIVAIESLRASGSTLRELSCQLRARDDVGQIITATLRQQAEEET